MNIDNVVYKNLMHLIEESGLTEYQVTGACSLHRNFFTNYRSGKIKHFKLCDVYNLACFFEVPPEYLLQSKNYRNNYFHHKYKLHTRDEQVLVRAFSKLDPEGRIAVSEAINAELENVRKRERKTIK